MTKEHYEKILETLNMQIEVINDEKKTARQMYIDANAPCKIDDEIEIVAHKIYIGKAKSFSIWTDKTVFVSCVQVGAKMHYLTKPSKSLKIITQ
jgi:hypothetical protein